ncbi:MAG: bifunctional riboflavin kinase/FAD synthetase [Flavobacteriaceae bacterium]|nr:bifunctional riboflavin kinase/FAD synthetase [Flavobacteriaceae bacterium]
MKVYKRIEDYTNLKRSFLTIGTFDGVHIGHQAIINKLVHDAHANNADAVVLTFFPHPRNVIQVETNLSLIDSMKEKENLLRKLGIDILIIHPFTMAFSNLSAQKFTRDILVNKLNVSKLFIGYDHRFGKNRTASVSDLISYGQTYDFDVDVIPAQDINAISVSSTKIRKALFNGDVKLVSKYLGRKYQLEGIVVHDQGLGSKIGFPTANIEITSKNKALPKTGVYWVSMVWKNQIYFGMLNFGVRPSVSSKKHTIEIHFFNFDENIYDETINISFHVKIRDEKKFDSLESLRKQLEIDKKFCYELEKTN